MHIPVRFEILGPLRVRSGSVELPVTARREQVLVASLALGRGESVSTDLLARAVWADEPPAKARNQLQKCVSALRKRIAEAGGGGDIIVTDAAGYRISTECTETDLDEFARLTSDARNAVERRDLYGARGRYRTALALWRGPALAGIENEWAQRTADVLTEQRLQVTQECVEVELAAGGAGELVAELTELVAQHPFREGLCRALMLALFRAGRPADALAAYRELRRVLVTELGQEPGASLRELHRRILSDDATLHAVKPPSTPRAALGPPRQLPAPPRTFTGRQAELAELAGLPDSSTVTVAAIHGMPGVGKTALAVHFAHRVAAHYPDGQLFIDLHGFAQGPPPLDPGTALDRALRALGVPGEQVPADLDERSALYRSTLAGRSVLILLDNAATEDQVTPLLPGTRGCLLLITSRRRMAGLDVTHTLSLETMPPTDAAALFTRMIEPDRHGPQPADLVARIVEVCGRLPLAIRVAAARLKSHPTWDLATMVERLDDHQHRLTELDASHVSVTAALGLSYRQLPTDEQRAYRLLGLHPGPDIDVHAAAALTRRSVARARRLLDALQEAHLLDESAPERYVFHDLIRAHAAAEARREPDRDTALTRLLDHYLSTAAAAVDLIHPDRGDAGPPSRQSRHSPVEPASDLEFVDATGAAAWLDTELPNLLATAAHAAAGERPDHTARLSATLHQHLYTRGRYGDAETLHRIALLAARTTGDRGGELVALTRLGHIRRLQGQHDQARQHFEQALEMARAIGSRTGELAALTGLGRGLRLLGRHRAAAGYLKEALEMARADGDHSGELDALTALGHVYRQRGRLEGAAEYFTRARRLARSTGSRSGERGTLTGLARVQVLQGHQAAAAETFTQALTMAQAAGDRTIELGALCGLGHIHRLQGDSAEAVDSYQQALTIANRIGSRNWQFEALHGLGRVHCDRGHPDAAVSIYHQALHLADALGQREDQVRAHDGIARAYLAISERELARGHWQTALEILNHLGNDHTEDGEATIRSIRAHLADLDRREATASTESPLGPVR